MKRWDIINIAVKNKGYKDYLEIGLDSGRCRDRVLAPNKTTVDPSNSCVTPTHKMTSDDFFKQNKEKFDVIFIDGLHEAEQVYRDIKNSLSCLRDGGTIFCHDMMPTSKDIQAVPRVSAIWTGDCWKAWAKLRGTEPELYMAIVQADWGVGVIRKGEQVTEKELDIPIKDMDWDFYLKHSSKFKYLATQGLESHL